MDTDDYDFLKMNEVFTIEDQTTHDRFEIKVVDGVAAGAAWIGVEILDGPHVGKGVWLRIEKERLCYLAEYEDDGFTFNVSVENQQLIPRWVSGIPYEYTGEIIPDWNGRTFEILTRTFRRVTD